MNMRRTAKETPASATAKRIFCRRSCSQARRPAEITPRSLRLDGDLDLEVRERSGARAVVEADLDLHDARVGARGGVRVARLELSHLHADPLDDAGELGGEGRAPHRRSLA